MKIIILSPVQHDGKQLEAGATANMKDKAAQALIECGSAQAADVAVVAKSNDGEADKQESGNTNEAGSLLGVMGDPAADQASGNQE